LRGLRRENEGRMGRFLSGCFLEVGDLGFIEFKGKLIVDVSELKKTFFNSSISYNS